MVVRKIRYVFLISLLASLTMAGPSAGQAPYFQNKTIKIVRGGEPGGTGDLQARALIPFLKKHIPGDPTIIVENMPGAAGMKAVNHIYASAKPDGLSIASAGTPIIANPILGAAGARYRSRCRFTGGCTSSTPAFRNTRHSVGVMQYLISFHERL